MTLQTGRASFALPVCVFYLTLCAYSLQFAYFVKADEKTVDKVGNGCNNLDMTHDMLWQHTPITVEMEERYV